MAKNDFFAQIAASGIQSVGKGLSIPQPPELEEKYFNMEGIDEKAVFIPLHKMSTREELYEEVERQKAYYRPFFEDYAPELENLRKRVELTECQWRIGTDADCQDFVGLMNGAGEWKKLMLPHYDEPRGVVTTYYQMTFQLSEEDLSWKSHWISFKGVDYKAHVFLNGMYLGSHEGFFAPFEFECSRQAKTGENTLLVMVENDYIQMGSVSERGGEMFSGDKFYAATGLGYDEAYEGWHCCPPGMGIYQDVYLEFRNEIFLQDIFVRPLMEEESAEIWLELYDCKVGHRKVYVDLSIYGQNFDDTVVEHFLYEPETFLKVGRGDSLTEAKMIAEGKLGQGIPLLMERGINYLKIKMPMKNIRKWDLNTPWLYQVQIRLLNEQKACLDTAKSQFGMREFYQDENSVPKGKYYLNGRELKMRGVNSMGFEQQCVFKKDWEQLFTDLILAKICNLTFIRLTQRPVQPEVYDYCDKLGMLLQTDLPMFGAMRRNQFAEGIRQVQEMEHLIRSHASAVTVSYINEPMPNAKNMPHRCLTREELEQFFDCADIAIRLLNPDRVIKHVDGDYDPPTKGYPDNHCYPCWYNGHGIDIGKLYKGYWMAVKEGWHYGCGEYGIEGLDPIEVMEKYYPKEWLPEQEKEEEWSPVVIPGTQTGSFHYFYYDTQKTWKGWIEQSHAYQAQAVTMMTESYRRDARMNSFAYHLFISAFPGGWCKTIMDVDRNPKQAYFAYRNALSPVLLSLRSDRWKGFAGEQIPVEVWICNDTVEQGADYLLQYQVYVDGKLQTAHSEKITMEASTATFKGFLNVTLPIVKERTNCVVQAALSNTAGTILDSAEMVLEAFPKAEEEIEPETIVITEYEKYAEQETDILKQIENGGLLVVQELPQGEYIIAGKRVQIKNCSMLPLHFVSRDTGHPLVEGFKPDDFKYWYDEEAGYITPLLDATVQVEGSAMILTSGNQDENGNWEKTGAAVEYTYGLGRVRICQVKLTGRTGKNPVAKEFCRRLLKG